MKVVLTIQLQQDNGTPVFTGTQTRNNFAATGVPNSVVDDFNVVNTFLTGNAIKALIRLMCWIANGQLTVTGTPTVIISSLGDAQGN
jgi:hypothetical protein